MLIKPSLEMSFLTAKKRLRRAWDAGVIYTEVNPPKQQLLFSQQKN